VSADGELLDPGIHRIRDVQAVAAVESQPVRQMEAAGLGPLPADAAQVLPVVGELLDAVVRGTDPYPVLPVDAQRDRTARTWRAILVRRRRPESAGLGAFAPPERQELSLGRELL